jgi:hypothetical protein
MSQTDLAATSSNDGNEENELLATGLICPFCRGKLIRRSQRRTFKDRLMSLLGKWPYRCLLCNERFSGPQDAASIARAAAAAEEGQTDDQI